MRTSALNQWIPLLELSPSMYISARLRRPYDLYVLNQTYDMAWPHVLLRSDSSFLCPHTSCIYICMEIWLACTTERALSAWCLGLTILSRLRAIFHLLLLTFNKAIVSFRSLAIRLSWEHRKSTAKNSLAEATNCNKGQGWPRGFLRWPPSVL